MFKNLLTDKGKLVKEVLPAIYFDSSVIIDYYISEGFYPENEHEEIDLDEYIGKEIPDEYSHRIKRQIELESHSHEHILRKLLNTDKKFNEVAALRDKILYEDIKVNPIVSPLAILELVKWFTESIFKQMLSESVGSKQIQRYGTNQIGNYLKTILERINRDIDNDEVPKWEKQGLKDLKLELIMSPSFVYHHGLEGLLQVDIVNFDITNSKVWSEQAAYSFLQMGAADIMHISFAEHLGCEYIATNDEDFKRAGDIIYDATGITVLKGYKEIINVF